MQPKVLKFLVALNLKRMLTELGFDTVGIAPDMKSALAYAEESPDIALVDVNLRDGETGPTIGVTLAQKYGASVIFITANPQQLSDIGSGPIGVLSKPVNDNEIAPTLDFLVNHREGHPTPAPPNVTLFS